MAVSAFGSEFGTGRSSKAGYGTPLGEAAGRTPDRQQDIDTRRYTLEAERNAKKLLTEVDTGPTNAEEREQRNTEKAIEARIKEEEKRQAEEAKRLKEEQERQERAAAAFKAAAAKAAAAKAKGEKRMGVAEADEPAPPTTSPEPRAAAKAAAPAAPAATDAQIKARQDAANRLKAGIRSGDPNIISAAREDAIEAGVPKEGVEEFIKRQDKELARRGEINYATPFGEKKSGLDDYYQAQTEKSRGVPLGFSSGRGNPIAPDWRIHSRLNRQLTARSQATGRDRSISPEAAAMKYEEAIMKKLARDNPLEYIRMRREAAEGRIGGQEMYGFGGPR